MPDLSMPDQTRGLTLTCQKMERKWSSKKATPSESAIKDPYIFYILINIYNKILINDL